MNSGVFYTLQGLGFFKELKNDKNNLYKTLLVTIIDKIGINVV